MQMQEMQMKIGRRAIVELQALFLCLLIYFDLNSIKELAVRPGCLQLNG